MAIILREFWIAPCEDCGMGAVNHKLERTSLLIDGFFTFVFYPLDKLLRRVMPFVDSFMNYLVPIIAPLFFKIGLAIKITESDVHSSETAQALWQEAKKRHIEMYEIRPLGLPRRHFVATFRNKSIVFEGLPRPARFQKSIHWIDDKAEMKKRFIEAGFPVARGGNTKSEKHAIEIFESLQKPVITKPQEGSGGRHTTVHIETKEELIAGYKSACIVAPAVIIEEELFGPVFRATLIDKKLVAVLQRDPPHVMGDGRSTVEELVAKENLNPLRQGPVFAEIKIDSPMSKKELARQKVTLKDVLLQGQKIYFHFKVNWGVGGISYDVTEITHTDNKKLFEEIGSYLEEDIVGIDFITGDITKSWRTQPRSGVIECNSLPLIGNHHFPYTGPVNNVAGKIWDMVFPESIIK